MKGIGTPHLHQSPQFYPSTRSLSHPQPLTATLHQELEQSIRAHRAAAAAAAASAASAAASAAAAGDLRGLRCGLVRLMIVHPRGAKPAAATTTPPSGAARARPCTGPGAGSPTVDVVAREGLELRAARRKWRRGVLWHVGVGVGVGVRPGVVEVGVGPMGVLMRVRREHARRGRARVEDPVAAAEIDSQSCTRPVPWSPAPS
jgi:hypothetical protein